VYFSERDLALKELMRMF